MFLRAISGRDKSLHANPLVGPEINDDILARAPDSHQLRA
jgi:hypothetical protein